METDAMTTEKTHQERLRDIALFSATDWQDAVRFCREAADHIDWLEADIAGLQAALGHLATATAMLLSNSLACLRDHHGKDVTGDLPGWLADARANIDAARALATRQTKEG